MSWSIKLFKIRDIDIKVHITFVLILVWAAWRWSVNTGAGARGALFGVAATLLLFAAVTLHELGHSFQALRFGVKVQGITLMPMGGIAQMEDMPKEPGKELRIAIAGPLVNFAIAGLLILVGIVLNAQTIITIPELIRSLGEANWAGMLAYLTAANLAIGVFNLIPAFPMDGGRVLRALLAMKFNYAQATSIAAKIGQGLALLGGLYGFMNGNWTLVLIAIFVWMGAGQEERNTRTTDGLSDLTVGQAMIRHPQVLKITDTLETAVELTLSTAQADFPVVHIDNRVVGLLTQADILRALRRSGTDTPVMDAMRTDYPVTQSTELLSKALQEMSANQLNAMPVVSPDQKLVGLLTAADINEAYHLLAVSPKSGLAAGAAS